jgi:hypothetical protein
MTATVFLILRHSAISMRREEPHAEHVSARGKLSAAARPVIPVEFGGNEKAPGNPSSGG